MKAKKVLAKPRKRQKGGFPVDKVLQKAGRDLENYPNRLDVNQPWGWEKHLDLFPQWLWLSDQWIEADEQATSDLWVQYVEAVQSQEEVPSLKLAPLGGIPDFLNQHELEGTMKYQNGPFVVDYLDGNQQQVAPDALLKYIPPGRFWIGLNVPDKRCVPLGAGVFIGFRRLGRPEKNPWWWECVYARLDKRGHLYLHAYNYNYSGMPLTSRKNYRSRARTQNVI
ncbi:uncharacterized protein LY89DRAFT_788948 [Mollisia scopiformis]|uniref:Uncharacterized protein n=1 Tax=Mollisia scopiformis TaxID=149040 RepID=A0A132B854_MOLSC|nr:uncharacterized protein LY89DRAFT_788948 [Mollisia scopiformis]KUJ08590.1 hypothetical protein LY89DRAFT_788948 [Mollisia scopiformis]